MGIKKRLAVAFCVVLLAGFSVAVAPVVSNEVVSVTVGDGGTLTSDAYMVIDLSGGSNASNYPVSYLSSVPEGGWTDTYKTTKLVLRKIPKGMFVMGGRSTDYPEAEYAGLHSVTLTKDFYIGVFEVTQKQWELVMGNRPSYFTNTLYYASRPVECVSYYEIRENPLPVRVDECPGSDDPAVEWPSNSVVNVASFMGRLRVKTGFSTFDLPTESQWEYACRAGTMTALNTGYNLTNTTRDAHMDLAGRYLYNRVFFNGTTIPEASCTTDSGTAKVGSYLANVWGLYDMHGNVDEWCLDWEGMYPGTVTDPLGAASGPYRVLRGGSWVNDYGVGCCSAYRFNSGPSERCSSYGFRVARTLP